MRVISGKYRGRNLVALEGRNTRPTSARVKEDMFNILDNWFIFEGKTSLDLFGGSGALSIEGLSRGVKFAHINDHHAPAIEVIKQNLHDIDKNTYEIMKMDFKKVMNLFKNTNKSVDLIYLDPPFPNVEYYYEFFELIDNSKILNVNGIVMTESPIKLELENIKKLTLLKYKDFKNKHFYLFRLEEENQYE